MNGIIIIRFFSCFSRNVSKSNCFFFFLNKKSSISIVEREREKRHGRWLRGGSLPVQAKISQLTVGVMDISVNFYSDIL